MLDQSEVNNPITEIGLTPMTRECMEKTSKRAKVQTLGAVYDVAWVRRDFGYTFIDYIVGNKILTDRVVDSSVVSVVALH